MALILDTGAQRTPAYPTTAPTQAAPLASLPLSTLPLPAQDPRDIFVPGERAPLQASPPYGWSGTALPTQAGGGYGPGTGGFVPKGNTAAHAVAVMSTSNLQLLASTYKTGGEVARFVGKGTEAVKGNLLKNQPLLDQAARIDTGDPVANLMLDATALQSRVVTNAAVGADVVVDAGQRVLTGAGRGMQKITNKATHAAEKTLTSGAKFVKSHARPAAEAALFPGLAAYRAVQKYCND